MTQNTAPSAEDNNNKQMTPQQYEEQPPYNYPTIPAPTSPEGSRPHSNLNMPGAMAYQQQEEELKALGLPQYHLDQIRGVLSQRDSLLRQDEILRMWLQGDTIPQIMATTGLNWGNIKEHINNGRRLLKEILNEDLELLAAERVEAFRDIKRRALCMVDIKPNLAPALLRVALDTEVNIGKITGVLNDKVIHLGKIEHQHTKMYDFADRFPPTTDAQFKELPPEDQQQKLEVDQLKKDEHRDSEYRSLVNEANQQTAAQHPSPLAEYHSSAHPVFPATSDLRRKERERLQFQNAASDEVDDLIIEL